MIRLLLAVAVTALVAPGAAEAASALAPCPGKPNVQCGTVDVPLDRTGMIAGRVSLYAENLPASGRPRGVMFLIAGGPGQASTRAFDLAESGDYYQALFPGYTLVAFDPRGTGRSGVLSCRGLQTTADADPDTFARLAAECATQIGPARVAYATRDHAEDIEAVRQALGLDRIALWGTSYGTKLAVAYALAHPERVERLLLDSVVLPESDDTFDTDTLRAIPGALGSICAGSLCRGVTANLGADVARLANRLAASPIRGPVVQTNGRGVVERVDGLRLLSIVVDADLSPGIAAELPAAVAAALRGRNQPLLRLAQLDEATFAIPDTELSFGLLAATNCADGRFPWSPTTPIAQRQAIFDAAVAALPAGATGAFGPWSAHFGTASLCRLWPVPSGGTPLGPGPLPDVPVLAVTGDLDMRTPAAAAIQIASRFRQGRVVVVPGVGHSVLGADLSGCSQREVQYWLGGLLTQAACPRVSPWTRPLVRFPGSVASQRPIGGNRGLPGRTLAAVADTLREAHAASLLVVASGDPRPVPGLAGGRLSAARTGLGYTLARYRDVPGVELSGQLTIVVPRTVVPFGLSGRIAVTGRGVAAGSLRLANGVLSGTLGGRRVSARMSWLPTGTAAQAQSSSEMTSRSIRPSSNSWLAR